MAREITGDEGKPAGRDRPRRRRGGPLLAFFNLLVYSLAAAVVVLVYLPRDDAPAVDGSGDDILRVLRNADAEALPGVELSEEAINGHLGRTLVARDEGILARAVSHGRAWVRLHDGRAEVFLERRIFGHVSTLSLELELEERGQERVLEVTGGRFGRLPVPGGALRLALPAFASLKDAYPEEIKALLSAKKITFEAGKMILSL